MNRRSCYFFLTSLLLAGCNYKVGHPTRLSGSNVFIEVKNLTMAPQIGPLLNRVISEELIKAGGVKVVINQRSADYSVTVNLLEYDKSANFFNSNDTVLASGFKLNMQANIEMRSWKNNRINSEFTVLSDSLTMRENSLSQPKDRQALMELIRSLGKKIAFRLRN